MEEGKKKIQRPKGEKYTLICLVLYRHIALHKCYKQKGQLGGFPGGAVVESLPANAGYMGSSPGLGRSHMPRSN